MRDGREKAGMPFETCLARADGISALVSSSRPHPPPDARAAQEWYGQWVSGIFLDETSYEADEVAEGDRGMCAKYRRYHERIKKQLGPSASVSASSDRKSVV